MGSSPSTSAIVGPAIDGPSWPCIICCHTFAAAWAAFRKYKCTVSFSLSSKGSRMAPKAVSTRSSRRATEFCSDNSPATVASRIVSRIRGLAATRAPRCAGRATSNDLLHPIPDWPAPSVACCPPSSVNPGQSLSSDPCPASSTVLAAAYSVRIVWPCTLTM